MLRSAIGLLLVAAMGAGCSLYAQAPQQDQSKPATPQQPAQNPAPGANPFPEDTGNVPVLPSASQPAVPDTNAGIAAAAELPPSDVDPVRSPDEPVAEPSSSARSGESSSSADLANLLAPPTDDETRNSRKGKNAEPPEHKETAQEDESVGNYYLEQKNWKAALSRFQSALVLDPDNPDVYWGLAESQRHLGDAANARSNYMKVMEYDPDSKHAKEAKRLLKEPEMATAPAPR